MTDANGFDFDAWLREGMAALHPLTAELAEKKELRRQLDVSIAELEGRISKLMIVHDAVGEDALAAADAARPKRQTGIKEAVKHYFASLDHGTTVSYAEVKEAVSGSIGEAVRNDSSLRGALTSLMTECFIGPGEDGGFTRTSGLPKPNYSIPNEVFEELKVRLRTAGDDGIIANTEAERRALNYWLSKELVEFDQVESVYRLKDESLLTSDEAPVRRNNLFDADPPPRHAR